MKKNLFKFCFLLFIIFWIEASFVSCASRSNPSGGARDTLAPVLDTAFPHNYSIQFNSPVIELVFNEYLNLKNPSQQIMFSPPMAEKPEIVLKGKKLFIELKENLKENTTYTISFGEAITDFTEGNSNKNFKYVFSTGTYIDSLQLSGIIRDAATGEPQKDLLVGLYEITDTIQKDSVPYLTMPSYYAFTNESGGFSMENLKDGNFYLIAFEDKLNKFKLTSTSKTIAFSSDTIQTTIADQLILMRSFTPENEYKYYGLRQIQNGLIQFNFNQKTSINNIQNLTPVDSSFFLPNANNDTIFFWFNAKVDSLKFLIEGRNSAIDTSLIYLRDLKTAKLTLKLRDGNIRSEDTLQVESNLPIAGFKENEIFAIAGDDTIKVIAAVGTNPLLINLYPENKAREFTLIFLKNSVLAWYQKSNDSLFYKIKTLKKEELTSLNFSVTTDSLHPYILQISDGQKRIIINRPFIENLEVNLKNIKPGTYKARLIVDINEDGEWTTGDYHTGRQPELIIHYEEPIELRANWELDLSWELKPGFENHPDPLKN